MFASTEMTVLVDNMELKEEQSIHQLNIRNPSISVQLNESAPSIKEECVTFNEKTSLQFHNALYSGAYAEHRTLRVECSKDLVKDVVKSLCKVHLPQLTSITISCKIYEIVLCR